MTTGKTKKSKDQYFLDDDGNFVIDNYSECNTFSNFFPGIAGLLGIPMWVFYVNRGQCVSSFGIEAKDKAIMEFQPANKAYRQTSLHGFRTFIKVKTKAKTIYWEPFQNHMLGTEFKKNQRMTISAHDLILEEENKDLGLKVRVKYFTLPGEPFPALVRQVTVINQSKKSYDIEIIDGMPVIVSYGLHDWLNKHLSRTAEAWVKVRNLANDAPFYQLNVEISDTPDVKYIDEGNFFFSYDCDSKSKKLLKTIVETSAVFGQTLDFTTPAAFLKKDFKVPTVQQTSNRTPSAFCHHTFKLNSSKDRTIASFIGYTRDVKELNKIVKRVNSPKYIKAKEQENKAIIDDVKSYAKTQSSSKEFDLYTGHTFLDNILRGGLPVSLKTDEGNVAFNVYSRKHGDLERDYNYFFVAPTYYSQGNGNYRDVNQNRRNDVWFNSDVGDHHLIGFLNLMQADGYNPLVVKGTSFAVKNETKGDKVLKKCVEKGSLKRVKEFIGDGFLPGDLLKFIDDKKIKLIQKPGDFLGQLLEVCQKQELADHGEGFWVDHWTYNLDLIESYLALYPDRLKNLALDNKEFTFYHDAHYVVPRELRYSITDKGIRQYTNVKKLEEDEKIIKNGNRLCVKNGDGAVYKTGFICKLLCLIANKSATLDPSGIGVEMEADKPGWYDSLNGLPGLIGSSTCETFEIKRHALFLLDVIEQLSLKKTDTIELFDELATFIEGLSAVLVSHTEPQDYWDKSNDVKERFRSCIRLGIDGKEKLVTVEEIIKFLTLIIKKTDKGLTKAVDSKGFLATYLYHEISEHEVINKSAHKDEIRVRPIKFKKHVLPLFLEGYVHALRVEGPTKKSKELYQNIRKSGLYDKKLGMYKVNADLSSETEEIGRTRIFPASWLENESIWLHMEYKFFLELLRCEMYQEFYDNFKKAFVPFLDPKTYGRSILENSSFIVSSAHEDKNLHGQGFVARLSGSTAEFMHMWLYMNAGKKPFTLDQTGKLNLAFDPALTGWLFTKEGTYGFNFLGSIEVTYHNAKRKNTFGPGKVSVKKVELTYPKRKTPVIIDGPNISGSHAQDVREKKVSRINIHLG